MPRARTRRSASTSLTTGLRRATGKYWPITRNAPSSSFPRRRSPICRAWCSGSTRGKRSGFSTHAGWRRPQTSGEKVRGHERGTNESERLRSTPASRGGRAGHVSTSPETQPGACRAEARRLPAGDYYHGGISVGFLLGFPSRVSFSGTLPPKPRSVRAGRADTLIRPDFGRSNRDSGRQEAVPESRPRRRGRLVVCDMDLNDTVAGDSNLARQGGFAGQDHRTLRAGEMPAPGLPRRGARSGAPRPRKSLAADQPHRGLVFTVEAPDRVQV